MKIRNMLAVAGLSLTVASFAPPVWAQVGGAGAGAGTAAPAIGGTASAGLAGGGAGSGAIGGAPGTGGTASSGMPGAGAGASGAFQQAPSAGQPGTQAPASAAPIGASTSDWMSSEGGSAAAHSSVLPHPGTTNEEKQLRAEETTLQRDLVAYRARGYNIEPAAWQKWLGSEALSRGDQKGASNHFNEAANDLRRLDETGAKALQPNNSSDAQLHGNETSQTTSASDMHSNKSSSSVY